MSVLLLTGVVRVETLVVENLEMVLRQLPGHGGWRDSLQGIDAAVDSVLTDDLILLPGHHVSHHVSHCHCCVINVTSPGHDVVEKVVGLVGRHVQQSLCGLL